MYTPMRGRASPRLPTLTTPMPVPLQVRGFRDLREAPTDPLLYKGFFNASDQNGVRAPTWCSDVPVMLFACLLLL